jgi:hypothetical protein
MLDRAFLALGIIGAVVALSVHIAAWFDWAPGFEVTFALFAGCLVVWWKAVTSARANLGATGPTIWGAVVTHAPPWLTGLRVPLTWYAGAYWAYVLYLQFIAHRILSATVWARFYAVFALIFYLFAAIFLVAVIRTRRESTTS